MNQNRRAFLRTAIGGATLAAASSFSYGTFVERRRIALEFVQCPIHQKEFAGMRGLRIALLSDLHFDEFGEPSFIEKAVSAINRQNVDLVAITGDFVSSDASVMPELVELLAELKATYGVTSVFGNHDRWHNGEKQIAGELKKVGVHHLVNESVQFEGLTVSGLDSIWGGFPKVKSTLYSTSKQTPTIVLWHEPDTYDFYHSDQCVLQLSGHTHGGQVCAPVVDELILPRFGKRYPKGLYSKKTSSLYVNRGLGVTSVPTRFLCSPEVTIIEMV